MAKPVCAIVGVGSGNGAAFARRFDREGYAVALLARSTEFTEQLASELESARAFSCDVTDSESIATAFAAIRTELGDVDVLLYNAGAGVFGSVEDISARDLELAWQVNALGAFLVSREVLPAMQRAGRGAIVFSGATASLRGGAKFAAFASAKAAQRNLAQSMARHLGPQGIHVALVIIDGMIDIPRVREMVPDAPDEAFLKPDDIAETVLHLVQQPRSAWTFEVDLRPFGERW
jgi:NAD(P)-dependent dehydrogenase (short-subunit alcohol dehydrogenase family)